LREKPDLGYNQQLEWYFPKGCAATTVHVGKKRFFTKNASHDPNFAKKIPKNFLNRFGGCYG